MSVAIIDYGLSNLGSILRSFEECGASVIVTTDPKDLKSASHIVLPGVGAFGDGMRGLVEGGWVEPLKHEVLMNRIPFLGICLGMQLMADHGSEGESSVGLGLIPGEIKRMEKHAGERIPHVGWNEIIKRKEHPLLKDIPDHANFYFVHSYCYRPANESDILAVTPYAGGFSSIIARENMMGTQFHPEKSQVEGFKIIKNFLSLPC